MARTKRLAWLAVFFTLVTACGAAFLYGPISRFMAIDSCLDHGGRWDDQAGGCEGGWGQPGPAAATPGGVDRASVIIASVTASPLGQLATAMVEVMRRLRLRSVAR